MSMLNGRGGWPYRRQFVRPGWADQLPSPRLPGLLGSALQMRLEHARRRLEFERGIVEARLHAVEAIERRVAGPVDYRRRDDWSGYRDEWRPGAASWQEEREEWRAAREEEPLTRRHALHAIFSRVPANRMTDEGLPSLGYVNDILEFQGYPPLESQAKLQAEYLRWRGAPGQTNLRAYPGGLS
jgi:hypothetical protein